ncbi:MAG TPA: hydroxyisourate hydrolase [Terracidiphilus sp.]|jgi:5-hydroxyisourate hydrolase
MSRISTHVLDTVLGKPAAGVPVILEKQDHQGWTEISRADTDQDGRCQNLATDVSSAIYRITFQTAAYLSHQGRKTIYPEISITFECDGASHYHLPLLLSDNSYTTYRGS